LTTQYRSNEQELQNFKKGNIYYFYTSNPVFAQFEHLSHKANIGPIYD